MAKNLISFRMIIIVVAVVLPALQALPTKIAETGEPEPPPPGLAIEAGPSVIGKGRDIAVRPGFSKVRPGPDLPPGPFGGFGGGPPFGKGGDDSSLIIEPYPFPGPRPGPIGPFPVEDDYNFTFVNTTDAFGDLGQAESVDLLFLVDVTGSMGSYIHGVKESIIGIVNLLTNDTEGEALVKNLRLSFVGYRDFGDDPNFETLGFTTNAEKFLKFVKGVAADGGGDSPEDVYGGMDRAIRQKWSSEVRVMLHIADAPCHGKKCGNSDPDPETTPQRKTPEELFPEIDEKDIRYNFGVITGLTKQMVKYFKEIAVKDFPLFDLRVEGGRGYGGGYAGGFGGAAGPDFASESEYRKIGTKDRYGYKVGSAAFGSVVNAIKG